MTIGKSSRKSSVRSSIRAPKFLDKSSGFYGRLDEPEVAGEEEEQRRWSVTEENVRKDVSEADQKEDVVYERDDFNEGMMEDDGETLLQRNTSRRSSRWRRSSRRRQKEGKVEEDANHNKTPGLVEESPSDQHDLEHTRIMIEIENLKREEEKNGQGKEPALAHFTVQEEKDDQVLIRDKKRGREEEEEEEERKMRREQEEGMKMLKRNSVKNYRKALDRAFRRGWEAFITNLYSVTLTTVTSSSKQSSSPASKKKEQHSAALAEFQ